MKERGQAIDVSLPDSHAGVRLPDGHPAQHPGELRGCQPLGDQALVELSDRVGILGENQDDLRSAVDELKAKLLTYSAISSKN